LPILGKFLVIFKKNSSYLHLAFWSIFGIDCLQGL